MIKKHYAGMQRRAENIIWNAAGSYDFDPPFMAFLENGRPDLYFDMVIGLCVRWLDIDRLTAFLDVVVGLRRGNELCDMLWLGIENCVYEKELASRPVLSDLRARRAQEFFKGRQTLSRQQMMLQSMAVYNQQQARWAHVLGRRGEHLSPREQALAKALEFSGSLDTDAAIASMTRVLREYFHCTVSPEGTGLLHQSRVRGLRSRLLKGLLRRETQVTDTLIVRSGTGEGDVEGSAQLAHPAGARSLRRMEADLAYVRQTLGERAIPELDLRRLENELCVGVNGECRLWVTKGVTMAHGVEGSLNRAGDDRDKALGASDRRDRERVLRDCLRQSDRNHAWVNAHKVLLSSSIKRLSARLDEVLSSAERALPERGRRGALDAPVAWRLPVLGDTKVFLRTGEETERSVTVDLLLDASASRLNYQEQLAAEAYVIAKSFSSCRVPVQVETFRSIRGYTVLQVLKDRDGKDCDRIFDYFAGGWNRDGLGLRLAGSLLPHEDDAALRLLLVLTDASPNDSVGMASDGSSILARGYQGRAAVLDAKDAVGELRDQGVRVAAVFLGPTLYLESLHIIYGRQCVRIHRIEQLDEAVSDLMELVLRDERR